ncbi:MAG: ABC transporter permease [Gemmatimonadota bacterium]|nr:ABC transporter permease [Gemmatimonadota bacterium]
MMATTARRADRWAGVVSFLDSPWAAPAVVLVVLATGAALLAAWYGVSAVSAFWFGSIGSWYGFTSGTLVRAVPLILTGLGVAIAFRAGVFNIGADGQLLAGATAAAYVGLEWSAALGHASLPAALILGTAAGALWAGVAALLRARFGVLEVISTLMLNFVATDLVAFLVRGPLQEPLHIYPQSATLPSVARLPTFGPTTRLHWGLALALVLAGAVWWFLARTAAGFRLRIVGANPFAAAVTGRVRVTRVAAWAFLASGALAGLAGAIEITAVTYALYDNLSPGYGFTAIAVAVLAGLNPVGVVFAGVLFAALETGATAMQRDAGVPSVWASVVEAALILILVAGASIRARAGNRHLRDAAS